MNIYTVPLGCHVYLQMWPYIYSWFVLLTANSGLFSCWFKSAVFTGHTKPPIQELSSFTQEGSCLCFIFSCYQNKHRANLLHQGGPIVTCLSLGLLIYNNWFAWFHPVLWNNYLQLSKKSNIYKKTTHAIEKIRAKSPALLLVWGNICFVSLPCWLAVTSCSGVIMPTEYKYSRGANIHIVFTGANTQVLVAGHKEMQMYSIYLYIVVIFEGFANKQLKMNLIILNPKIRGLLLVQIWPIYTLFGSSFLYYFTTFKYLTALVTISSG